MPKRNTVQVSPKVSFLFTSDEKLGWVGDEGVLLHEAGGRDLAHPVPAVVLEAGLAHPQGAVPLGWAGGPLVLAGVEADGEAVALPPAVPLLPAQAAGEDSLLPGVHLTAQGLLHPLLIQAPP